MRCVCSSLRRRASSNLAYISLGSVAGGRLSVPTPTSHTHTHTRTYEYYTTVTTQHNIYTYIITTSYPKDNGQSKCTHAVDFSSRSSLHPSSCICRYPPPTIAQSSETPEATRHALENISFIPCGRHHSFVGTNAFQGWSKSIKFIKSIIRFITHFLSVLGPTRPDQSSARPPTRKFLQSLVSSLILISILALALILVPSSRRGTGGTKDCTGIIINSRPQPKSLLTSSVPPWIDRRPHSRCLSREEQISRAKGLYSFRTTYWRVPREQSTWFETYPGRYLLYTWAHREAIT